MNATRGWLELAGTKPELELTAALSAVGVEGRDGVVSGLGATVGPSMLTFLVDVPATDFAAVVALARRAHTLTRDDMTGISAGVEYASHTTEDLYDGSYTVTILLRVPGAAWRSSTSSISSAVTLGSASVVASVFSGLSGPVQDAVIRVKGQAAGVVVTDSSGAWLTTPDIAAGNYVRFESDTGRAFQTSSDTWTGGTEISGLVDFGGPRGVFEITPNFTTDPTVRSGSLTVSTTSRVGANIQVSGRGAFVV